MNHQLKTIVICRNDPRHMFFANKMDDITNVKALIVQSSPAFRKKIFFFPTFTRKINELYKFIRLTILNKIKNEAVFFFEQTIPKFKNKNHIIVSDINDNKLIDLINGLEPDLILTFGCGILKHDKWFKLSKYGIINLHSGIVPNYRGVDNVFWCLFNHEPNMIGSTVHFIDRSIDTGNILAQIFTPIDKNDNELTLFNKTIKHGIVAFEKVINKIVLSNNKPFGQTQMIKGHLYQEKDRSIYCDLKGMFFLIKFGLNDFTRDVKYVYYL
ncbi:uncharacterized protein METZ01_LOCUS264249 [marine metagenome]|uniref:phosphoribosylglycinamide formyltransferase 1 n=1 Tax=marine metagenome TaxID=408172 RepID=A0A382JIA8_9ZZZZ